MRRVKYWLYKNDKVLQDRLTDTNKSAVKYNSYIFIRCGFTTIYLIFLLNQIFSGHMHKNC
jgi:hypothetical protein